MTPSGLSFVIAHSSDNGVISFQVPGHPFASRRTKTQFPAAIAGSHDMTASIVPGSQSAGSKGSGRRTERGAGDLVQRRWSWSGPSGKPREISNHRNSVYRSMPNADDRMRRNRSPVIAVSAIPLMLITNGGTG